MGGELIEQLHARRAEYERTVLRRFPRAFGPHDAEDLVSTALDRALRASAPPEPGREAQWFDVLVTNVARDELRRRHGRSVAADGSVLRRTVLLSQLQETGQELVDQDSLGVEADSIDRLDEDVDRERTADVARRALEGLKEEEAELLRLRHVVMPHATRDECAEAAGLTLDGWRWRYRRAWGRFVSAVAADEPTERCREIRVLVGALEGGMTDAEEAAIARGRVDAHVVECPACRTFTRASYHVLSPGLPAGTLASATFATRAAQLASDDRVVGTASAGATGVGLLAWLGASGSALKALTVICAVSVTTASVCGGVISVIKHRDDKAPKRERRADKAPARAAATPTSAPIRIVTTPTPRATARPTRTPRPKATTSPARRTTRTATQSQPAAPPSGTTGNEFDPVPAKAASQPAPVSSGVAGEFAP